MICRYDPEEIYLNCYLRHFREVVAFKNLSCKVGLDITVRPKEYVAVCVRGMDAALKMTELLHQPPYDVDKK